MLMFVWIFDFVCTVQDKDPKFCISKKTHEFDDGTVDSCVGLGYKIYNYDRESVNIDRNFGLFFMKMD